jgi:hypothetical protein
MVGLAALASPTGVVAVEISASPDVAVDLSAATVLDREAVRDDGAGGLALLDLPDLGDGVDLSALDLQADGSLLFAVDVTASLPSGLTARPCDVVRKLDTDYSLAFDGHAAGVPDGVAVDAVAHLPSGELLLSFDVSIALGALPVDDEDVVRFDGSGFSLFADGSEAGIDPALDLDGLDYAGQGRLAVSLDGSGSLAGVLFDDEDVVSFDPGGLDPNVVLTYRPSAAYPEWAAADLDAVALPEPVTPAALAAGMLLLAALARRGEKS